MRLAEILAVSVNHFYDAPRPDGFDDALKRRNKSGLSHKG
jgi:hypothetical protein